MLLREDTYRIQSELAEYCRTGELKPIKGAKTDRLHHYRRLVFNVVNDSLETAYPITRDILSNEQWDDLVNDFFQKHDPKSPQIWKLPFEFYQYCLEKNYAELLKMEFLNDLLYFEWIEIEVHTMKDEEIPAFDDQGDLLESPVIINPEYRLLHLQYPVHKMPASELVQNKGDYFVVAYRHQDTLSVKFFELSALFGVVFEILAHNSLNARTALSSAAEMFNIDDEQELIQNSLPFLNDLVVQGIILGFKAE